jgi:hypothetical protein
MILRFVRSIPHNARANASAALAKSASVIHHRKADLEPLDTDEQDKQAGHYRRQARQHDESAYHLT